MGAWSPTSETQQITIFGELGRLATQNRLRYVILRSEATKNLVLSCKNETLRFAQGDNCDLLRLLVDVLHFKAAQVDERFQVIHLGERIAGHYSPHRRQFPV